MDPDVALPAMLPAKARALGATGEAWLRALPDLVRDVEARWGLSELAPLTDGTEAFVAIARRVDGSLVVLKVGLPGDGFGAEVDTLVRARGLGYVEVLAHDPHRGAVLLERLGSPLARSGLPPQEQMAILGRLLPQAWAVPRPRGAGRPVDKASQLAAYIETAWDQLGGPAPRSVRDRALSSADRRARAFREEGCVVVHGDAASANALRSLTPRVGAETGYVFVDPEGFVGDPAYDVGVALRDWCAELLAAADPRGTLQSWCRLVADGAGLDAGEVGEWAFVERVSTGLYCLELGATEAGRPFLDSAALLT